MTSNCIIKWKSSLQSLYILEIMILNLAHFNFISLSIEESLLKKGLLSGDLNKQNEQREFFK